MSLSLLDHINETYMAPYFTGEGRPAIPPRHSDNRKLNWLRLVSKVSSIESGKGYLDALYVRYPVVTTASCFCYQLPKISRRSGDPVNVALRVNGDRWLTRRGKLTHEFTIMSYNKAVELSRRYTMFDYALIEWSTIRLEAFMICEAGFNKTPIETILNTEITPQHITVAREVQRVLERYWHFMDHLQ